MNENKQYDIVHVTEANARLSKDGCNLAWQRWVRDSDYEDRLTGYVLYPVENSHNGVWFRTKREAKQHIEVMKETQRQRLLRRGEVK